MAEHCVRRRDPVMTGQRQVKASAHAVSEHSGIHRGWKSSDSIRKSLPSQGKFIRLGSPENSNLIEIGASGEEMLIAGDHERLWILSHPVYQSSKFEDAGVSETVG